MDAGRSFNARVARFNKKIDNKGNPLEKKIEKRWNAIAKKYGWEVRKFKTERYNASPDRIYLRNGFAFFIEFKRKDIPPTPAQTKEHELLRKAGFVVMVVDRMDDELADIVFL